VVRNILYLLSMLSAGSIILALLWVLMTAAWAVGGPP